MTDLKQQISKELNNLEERVRVLRSVAKNASTQTDLEVAILSQQVKKLQEKNKNADLWIEKSISILKILK